MLTQIRANPNSKGAAYREFSRRRYRELKAQSHNLREADIVAKVIREWDAMNMEQKNKFSEIKNETMVMLNVQPLSTPLKGDMPMMKAKTNQKTTVQKKVQKMEMMEGSGSEVMEEINVREFDDSSASKGMKTKKIAHAKNKNNSQYISFFKSYFNRLMKEHPKWSARQITSIIKLLWKKRKVTKEGKQTKPVRLCRPISGRMCFRKTKSLYAEQAMMKWKRFPLETKNMWVKMGMPAENKMQTPNTMKATTMRFAQGSSMQMNQLNFINMKMI